MRYVDMFAIRHLFIVHGFCISVLCLALLTTVPVID